MTGTRLRFRRHRSQFQSLLRGLRYRLIVPVFRSCRSPEYTARGVANGVFWALTPTVGLQTAEIVLTWIVARRGLGKDSSLLQAFIWAWINNPLTMLPMYYVFYLTGLWLLGDAGTSTGYDGFDALWTNDGSGWLNRVTRLAGSIGAPTLLGAIPYAVVGAIVSYRWALNVGRRRKARLARGGAAHLPAAPSGI